MCFSKLPLHHRNLAKYSGKLEKEKRSYWRTDKGQVSFVFIQLSNLSNDLYLPVRHLEYIFDDNIRLDGEFPHVSKFIVIIIIIMCDYTGTMINF